MCISTRAGVDFPSSLDVVNGGRPGRLLYVNLDRLDVADHVGSTMRVTVHGLHVATGIGRPRHHDMTSHAWRCAPPVFP